VPRQVWPGSTGAGPEEGASPSLWAWGWSWACQARIGFGGIRQRVLRAGPGRVVEVFDGRLWHRIDLGGAAANLDNEPDPSRPAYLPPPDPYAWPASRDSGQDLAERNRNQGNAQGSSGTGNDAGDAGAAPGPGSTMTQSNEPQQSKLPESEVSVTAIDGDVHRGLPLHLQGQIASAGSACAHLRVDVLLVGHVERGGPASPVLDQRTQATQATAVGSLSTDEKGRYDGAVVIPRDFALGDYDLVVQTPGDARCGPGRTR